jgi:hypothetical protein
MNRRPKSRLLRVMAITAAVAAATFVTLLLVGRSMLRAEPGWWAQTAPIVEPAAAERLENHVVADASGVRPLTRDRSDLVSEPFTITIDEAEANAWLGTRLGDWLRSRGVPERFEDVRVSFEPGEVLIGARIDGGRTAWASVPTPLREGEDPLAGASFYVGRVPVPRTVVLEAIKGTNTPPHVVRIDEARSMRILKVEAGEGVLTVTARHEADAK